MQRETVRIEKFAGINNTQRVERVKPQEFQNITNFDVTDTNGLERRPGYSRVYSGNVQSAMSYGEKGNEIYFLEGGSLKALDLDLGVRTLSTGFSTNGELAYVELGPNLYFSDGTRNGVIFDGQLRSWGIPTPQPPVLAFTTGGLSSGTYMVKVTHESLNGRESGASEAVAITLTATGGITISGIPVSADPDVSFYNIYMTSRDGSVFYHVGQGFNGQTTVSIGSSEQVYGAALKTDGLYPMPPGRIVANWNGRILLASGPYIWATEPYGELTNPYRNYIPLKDEVTMVAPVANGIWIGTKLATYFAFGEDFDKLRVAMRANYGVVYGTATPIDAGDLLDGRVSGGSYLWATDRGICVGYPDGTHRNLTGGRYEHGKVMYGSGALRFGPTGTQYLAGSYRERSVAAPTVSVDAEGSIWGD